MPDSEASSSGHASALVPLEPIDIGMRGRRGEERRLQLRVATRPYALVPHLTYLQASRVRKTTQVRYIAHLMKLARYLQTDVIEEAEAEVYDMLLEAYINFLVTDGSPKSAGYTVMAAVMWAIPSIGRSMTTKFPKASAAMKGWNLEEPGRSRPPLPKIVVQAMALSMLHRGRPRSAVMMEVMFETYIRPSEAVNLEVRSVVPPFRSQGKFSPCTLLVHPWEAHQGSKTGERDVSLPLDLARQDFLVKPLLSLAGCRPPTAKLFETSYREFAKHFKDAVEDTGVGVLQPTPYSLRHGGASHDRWTCSRDLAAVMQRGAWRSLTSVLRYDKHGRLGLEMRKLDRAKLSALERETSDYERAFTRLFWANVGGRVATRYS